MEIRDPIHGSIRVMDAYIPILRNSYVERLRNIKQLGLSETAFPGATHTRYLHSVGVMHIAQSAFDRLFHDRLGDQRFQKLRETVKLAALLHDIGHAPLSHSTEMAMPLLEELSLKKIYLPPHSNLKAKATHEDYTVKTIVESSLTNCFSEISKSFQVEPDAVAELISKNRQNHDYYIIDGINYFPILSQLVSSEMDCDRMDYLLRDSYFCGVSYGRFDLDWLLDNLKIAYINNEAILGISQRAIPTFDDFLLSRYNMFLQVYFHYRSVCREKQLAKFFETSPDEYKIPSDLVSYLEHDDYHLMKILRKSKNPYAKALTNNQVPDKIFESFSEKEHQTLERIQTYLEQEKIEFIKSSSRKRITKYEQDSEEDYSIQVVRTLFETKHDTYQNINLATELYKKYEKTHEVNRLYCDYNSLPPEQQKRIIKLVMSEE